jgi:hypothetical protein
MGIILLKEFDDLLGDKLLPVIRVKDLRIADKAKISLKLIRNKACVLVWKRGQVDQTGGVVFDGHDPTHPNTIFVLPSTCSHVNEINLETIAESPLNKAQYAVQSATTAAKQRNNP